MLTLLIDNDDSFTWNLFQQVRSLGSECDVIHHENTSVAAVKKRAPDRIILSPGPGGPARAKVSLDLLRDTSHTIPILGVCLGHQCIAHVFGSPKSVGHAPLPMHGKTSEIFHRGESILRGVPSPFVAARYHSLAALRVPEKCEVLCWTGSMTKPEIIMGLRHTSRPIVGVQFHPESFLTSYGDTMMKNFLYESW